MTKPGRADAGGNAATAERPGPTKLVRHLVLLAVLSAAVLSTIALGLWLPIDQGAINRADDAGWDQSLLITHQHLLTLALVGTCLCTWLATFATVFGLGTRAART